MTSGDSDRQRRERRAAIADGVLAEMQAAVERLGGPFTAFNFGGRENTYSEQELPVMPPRELLAVMQAMNHGSDVLRKLAEIEGDRGLEEADSMLGRLAERFGLNDEAPDIR